MQHIKAPNKYKAGVADRILFLAGSIEQDKAEPWQEKVVEEFKNESLIILNPRRDNWDESWENRMSNPQFAEQVDWELEGIADTDFILLYFDPNTKSPISLLELGLMAENFFSMITTGVVVCPDGFWRKGNVEIVCMNYDIPLYNTLEEGIKELRKRINGD